MSSRTSKASFPPDFCSLSWTPSPPLWACGSGLKSCAFLRQLAVAVTLMHSRQIYSSSEDYFGHWKPIWICRAVKKKFILQALSVLFYSWVSLFLGNTVIWLICCIFTPADGTVGAGALLPLVDRFNSILLGHTCISRIAARAPCAAFLMLGGGTCVQINCAVSARHLLLWPMRVEDSQSIYYWGENSWVIWCKLRCRSSFNPGWACDYAFNFPRKCSLSCSEDEWGRCWGVGP